MFLSGRRCRVKKAVGIRTDSAFPRGWWGSVVRRALSGKPGVQRANACRGVAFFAFLALFPSLVLR